MRHMHRPDFAPRASKTLIAPFALIGFTLLTALSIVVSIVGCGQSKPEDAAPTTTPPAKDAAVTPPSTGVPAPTGTLKVALVTPGAVSDNGWNAGAYKGLQAVKTQLGADVENVEANSPSKREENLRAYASKGYNVVIGHGTEFEDLALKIEGDFPKTLFVISSGAKTGKNTQPIILLLEDGAYLEGMLAAGMSKTGKIGSVGAERSAPVDSVFKAFELGAKTVNPSITVNPPSYTGDWEDVAKAKAATNALLDQGADVIMQDLDAAAQGVFQAVQQRAKLGKPVYALGTNNDQNSVAPDVILASAPITMGPAFVAICTQVKAGTFKPNTTPYDMKSGVIGFVLNPQLESKIPADLKTKLDEAQKRILAGTLVIPKGGS
jgi:basic membrane lipoprotein Med (substrate-binding protein (PBP1-ABC) superfamily)